MTQLAILKFQSQQLKLPASAAPNLPRKPTLDFEFQSRIPAGIRTVAVGGSPTAQSVPPAMFVAPSNNASDITLQRDQSQIFRDYITGICTAICSAWAAWQSSATLVGVVVNAVTASGGVVVGPPLTPLILAQGPNANDFERKRTSAIAEVIGTAWLSYTATLRVPGLPWYPAFAAVPSPVAPPSPNIPNPILALTQVATILNENSLKSQMTARFGVPEKFSDELFAAIASAFERVFNLWQVSTMVTNVLGTGPVPTFAPPYVPVGPVVGGVGTMLPGGFT